MAERTPKYGADTDLIGSDATPATFSGTTPQTGDINNTSLKALRLDIWVDINFDPTPTDDVIVEILSSDDGSDWDDLPAQSTRIDNGTDPSKVLIQVENPARHVRVNAYQTGPTDSHDIYVHYSKYTEDIV